MSDLSICGDRWHGVANDEWHVDAPSWDDVSRAIRRLDGRTYTLVTIGGSGRSTSRSAAVRVATSST